MVRVAVRVTPRASRDAVTAFESGVLHVRVTAAPADGAANGAVTHLLAAALGLAARDVTLVSGAAARLKRFELPLDEAELTRRVRDALSRNR